MASHSELQRLQDDADANAPEAAGSRRVGARSDDQPEALYNVGGEEKEAHQPLQSTPPLDRTSHTRRNSRRWWILTLFLLICIAGLAIGLGVDLSIRKSEDSNSTSAESTTTTALPSATSATTAIPQPSSSLTRGIKADSPLAAVTQVDGTKHVVFQDINGQLRHAVASGSGNQENWDASLQNVIATNARSSTPLGAFVRLSENGQNSANMIYLFYVNSSNSLNSLNFQTGLGWSSTISTNNFSSVANLSISQVSTSLSVVVGKENQTERGFGILLALHDSNEDFLSLYGYESQSLPGHFEWTNVTTNVSSIGNLPNGVSNRNLTFSNFGVATRHSLPTGGGTATLVNGIVINHPYIAHTGNASYYTLVYDQIPDSNASLVPEFELFADFNSTLGNSSSTVTNPIFIRANDSAALVLNPLYGAPADTYFIQNNKLVSSNGSEGASVPPNPFPFSNTAVTFPVPGASSPEVLLYHQLNESAFAEEIWIDDAGSWTLGTIISVDTST